MVGSATDTAALPKFSLALSPHKDSSVSLGPMSDRIRKAASSVLFAVMEPTGQGPVLTSLRQIAAVPTVFSYGTVETNKGLAVQSPDGEMGIMTSFAALTKNVPEPFKKETDGGMGMHIHDKFVVVDFNGANPAVFTGSSNLAAGGEEANGDSLAMIEDGAIANMYAIEALATFDHFHFRKVMQTVKSNDSLGLWYPGKPNAPPTAWWKSYYDPKNIHMRDRLLFAAQPLPPGLATTKNVDWSAVDAAAAKKPAAKGKSAATGATKTSPSKSSAKEESRPRKSQPRKSQPRKSQPRKSRPRRRRNPRQRRHRRKRKKAPRRRRPQKSRRSGAARNSRRPRQAEFSAAINRCLIAWPSRMGSTRGTSSSLIRALTRIGPSPA